MFMENDIIMEIVMEFIKMFMSTILVLFANVTMEVILFVSPTGFLLCLFFFDSQSLNSTCCLLNSVEVERDKNFEVDLRELQKIFSPQKI